MTNATTTEPIIISGTAIPRHWRHAYKVAAKGPGRYAMNGVKVEWTDGYLRFILADGRILLVLELPLDEGTAPITKRPIPCGAILPIEGFKALAKMGKVGDHAFIENGGLKVNGVTYAWEHGEFPKWECCVSDERQDEQPGAFDPFLLATLAKACGADSVEQLSSVTKGGPCRLKFEPAHPDVFAAVLMPIIID